MRVAGLLPNGSVSKTKLGTRTGSELRGGCFAAAKFSKPRPKLTTRIKSKTVTNREPLRLPALRPGFFAPSDVKTANIGLCREEISLLMGTLSSADHLPGFTAPEMQLRE